MNPPPDPVSPPLPLRPDAHVSGEGADDLTVSISKPASRSRRARQLGLPAGNCVSLPGYHFLDCLSRTEHIEVWKIRTPEGHTRLARLVRGFRDADAQLMWERIIDLKSGSHPALVRAEVARSDPGRVIVLCDPVEATLTARFRQHRRQRLQGIPRTELLAMLRPVAEALDLLYKQARVQHLALCPEAILWENGSLFLADVGLVQALEPPRAKVGPARQKRGLEAAAYSAPEWALRHQPAPTSDQYSLALVYAEMLTGTHPLHRSVRDRARPQRDRWKPDLDLLPGHDRDAIARALSSDPLRRHPSCLAFLDALDAATRVIETEAPQKLPLIIPSAAAGNIILTLEQAPPAAEVIRELVALAAGAGRIEEHQRLRYLLRPGESIQHRCVAHLPPGVATLKLDGFCRRWEARAIYHDERSSILQVAVPRPFWQVLFSRPVGLEVEVQLTRPHSPARRYTEATITMRPFGATPPVAAQLLSRLAPPLLESLRAFLQAVPEVRKQERLAVAHPLRVSPVFANYRLGGLIECQPKDISLGGIGFFLPQQPPSSQLYVNLAMNPSAAELAILAKVVRVKPSGGGWYEVGALFVPEEGNGRPCITPTP